MIAEYIIGSILVLIPTLCYLFIGFIVALFAYDNPPKYMQGTLLGHIVFALLVIFWGPLILIGAICIFFGNLFWK